MADNEPNYHEPFSIVKFKRGATPNPYDENELFSIKLFPKTSSYYKHYGHYAAKAVANPKYCELVEYDYPHPPKDPTYSPTSAPTGSPSGKPSPAEDCLYDAKVFRGFYENDELGYSVDVDNDIAVLGLPGAGGMDKGALVVLDLTSDKLKIALGQSPAANSRSASAVATDGHTVSFGAPAVQYNGAFGYIDVDYLNFYHPQETAPGSTSGMVSGIVAEKDSTLNLFPVGGEDESRNWNIKIPEIDSGMCGASIDVAGSWLLLGCPGINHARLYDIRGAHPEFKGALLGSEDGAALGTSVALDRASGYLAVGAPKANGGKGEVLVYKKGEHTHTLDPPDGAANFGQSIAMFDGVLVVGAPGAYGGKGAAFVYYLTYSDKDGKYYWKIIDKLSVLTAHDGAVGDAFGYSVAIDGYAIIVGAYKAKREAGSAYYFKGDSNGKWYEIDNIVKKADVADEDFTLSYGDQCGFSVAVSGNLAIVGCPGDEDSTGTALFINLYSCPADE